ncbi:hypothetical protein ABK040_000318 [Willaertia magna]
MSSKLFGCGAGFKNVIKTGSVNDLNNDNNKIKKEEELVNTFYYCQPISINLQNKIDQISCGVNFIFILLENNDLYASGDFTYNNLQKKEIKYEFTKINYFLQKKIIKISSGEYHTLFLLENNEIYGLGCNLNGQLGLGHVNQVNGFVKLQIPVTHFTKLENRVKDIFCKDFNSVLFIKNSYYISGTNQCFGCGDNFDGALGFSMKEKYFTNFTKIISLKIKDVTCGGFHTIVKDVNGNIYGCGHNENGQLGMIRNVLTTRTVKFELLIDFPTNYKVLCGHKFSLIYFDGGRTISKRKLWKQLKNCKFVDFSINLFEK